MKIHPSFPVTPAELDYLRLRARLRIDPPAARYMLRRSDVDGGISVEDGWPGDPYLLVRLTRDRAAHEANLLRLTRFPARLRTAEVRYSMDELDRIARRVYRERRDLEAAGFTLLSSTPHVTTNTARVTLITARTDHAEYFAQRYGPVTTEVIAAEPTSLACAEARRYAISATGRSLVLDWESLDTATFERVDVVERPDRVELGIVERVRNGAIPYEGRQGLRRVVLRAPLGDRPVIDTASGMRLRQRGPSPGEPPCPAPRTKEPTRAEQRYLDLLDEFFFDFRVRQYIDRHQDEYGGGESVTPFPRGPFRLEYFTRRVAYHRANLKRLTRFPRRLRVRRSQHTVAEIEAIGSGIQKDAAANVGFLDGWGDAGFYVRGTFALPDRLLVYVVTPRDDHAAYFRARYGPSVRTRLVSTRYECET